MLEIASQRAELGLEGKQRGEDSGEELAGAGVDERKLDLVIGVGASERCLDRRQFVVQQPAGELALLQRLVDVTMKGAERCHVLIGVTGR
jgi:hypothetical protein